MSASVSSDPRPSTPAPSTAPFHRSRLGYLPALDGLRALAVIAVVAFHGGLLSGGFIGVDVFFAISGYLITGLALSEIEADGRLDLTGFWVRRARRLLPALFALVTVVVLVVLLVDITVDERVAPPGLGSDVLATLAYIANWTRAFGGDAYFDAYQAPSLLQHTWSLAVEEQFYVIWPLVLVGLVAVARRNSVSFRALIGVIAGGFAIASTVWATWLANAGPPFDRLYFGTDTRAVGLATGCAVACATVRGERTASRTTTPAMTGLAVLAAVVLVVLASTLDGGEQWLYGPGFAAISAASVILVDVASRSGPVAAVLAVRPLPAIGRVSYGIYLWHWPTIVILDRERTGLDGPAIWALWVAVTAAATASSWYLVERRAPAPTLGPRLLAYCAVPLLLVVGAVLVEGSTRPPIDPSLSQPAPAQSAPAQSAPAQSAPADPALAEPAPAGESPESSATNATTDTPADDETTTSAVSETLPTDRPVRILVLGDSVAESLGTAPPVAVDGRPVEVVNSGIIACPIHPIGEWRYDNGSVVADPFECENDDRFDAVIAATRPDIVIAMFGWPGTIAARTLDDGRTVAACDPEHDVLWAAGFVDLAERYADETIVVAATVAPPQRFVDPSQSARPECLNEALRSTDSRIIEWGEWMCPTGDCTRAAALRRDPVHFAGDPEVLAIVWDALLRQALDAAVR